MTDTVQTLLTEVSKYRYNPAGIQRSALGLLRDITQGKIDVVDPTNPLVFCLEASAINTAAFMVENKTLNRKQYPFAAQTPDELYPHMSDKDYADRFAVPATTKILFLINQDELLSKLVAEPGNTGIRKLVIPRNTYVTVVDSLVFSIQYPVEIRQMAHGGLQIVHIADQPSPLKQLTTNLIPWNVITSDEGIKYVGFELEVQQFNIITRTASINTATGFKTQIELTQQYYYCRVWIDNGDGTYTEVKTTHTDEVYDSREVTAVLKVTDNVVEVKIPQIYMTLGLINKSLRIDVYQTKGPIEIALGNYSPDQFVVTFHSQNKSEIDQYVTPLSTLRSLITSSQRIASGGSDAMSFEALRERVIKNAIGSPDLPITNVQVESALQRQGYQVVKNIDNITNRQFLATRSMPDPDVDSDLITAAAAGIGKLSVKLSEAVLVDTVVDNGKIITFTPDTLYRLTGGVLQLVPTSEVQTLNALASDQLALVVSAGGYMYSPFHYVLDATGNEFNIRPYYLDNPKVENKSFVGENDSTLLQVSTSTHLLEKTPEGYKLRIQTSSSDAFKALSDDEVFVQLAYLPAGDTERAYLMGELVGKIEDERVYEFDLSTNYSINSNHELSMLKFQMYDDSDRIVNLPIFSTFDILYSTDNIMGAQWVTSDIDKKLGLFQLPANTKAITHEQLTIRLGHYLEYLWARSRSVVAEENYERWATDVPALYEADVYERDPVTGAAFSIVNGELVYNIAHKAGDPVVDGDGNPVYKFRQGDIKFDAYGAPILINSRSMMRQIDLFLVEGTYYFATNKVSIDYRKKLVNTVVDWLTDDLPNMGDNLLERTNIYFYPTTTLGSVDVMFGAGLTTTIDAGQSFEVTLYVSSGVYSNTELRNTMTRKTIEIISDMLRNKVVSMSDIVNELRTQYESDVVSLDIRGLGGQSNYSVLTMMDDANRLSIRKKLVSRNDETLALEESITVTFVKHERTSLLFS